MSAASRKRRTRLDPGLSELWLVRWMRENSHPTTTVLFDRETAVSYFFRKMDAGLALTRLYRVDIAGLVDEPPSEEEARASRDARFGPVIWRGGSGHVTDPAATLELDAESVEFVVDGSPGGPATDLLDSARFAPVAPAAPAPQSLRA